MSDIGLFIENNCWNLRVSNGDLESDEGFETAVAISLFTDKRVTDEQLPELQQSKRGWWGDMFPEEDQDQIGSRLWTLERRKITLETLRLVEDFASESLQWFVEDGIAISIRTFASVNTRINTGIDLKIDIFRPDGRQSRFSVLWDAQEGIREFSRTI